MSNFDTERVLAGRVRMYVRDWPGGNPPVLFVHDLLANGLSALRLSTLLVHRRRLLAPDLRGRGKTDIPFGDYGVQIHVRDLIACLDTVGIDQFVAMGHGYGATISLSLAANYPERVNGLILLDGGGIANTAMTVSGDHYYASLDYHFPSSEAYVDLFKNDPLYESWTGELESYIRSSISQQPDGSYIRHIPRYVVETDRRAENDAQQDLRKLYRKVKCPVLILRADKGITGAEDLALPDDVLATMQDAFPASQVVRIPEANHTTILTVPSAERNSAILEFLGLD